MFFRAFEFLSIFLHEFGIGDKTLVEAVNKAYERSLSQYHGLLARSVFSVSEEFYWRLSLYEHSSYVLVRASCSP